MGSLVAFWSVTVLLIAVPGADWAFTIAVGVAGRPVLPAVMGLVVGYLGLTVVVAAGVGALVAGSSTALTVLTLVGGAYLVWHGAVTLARPSAPIGAAPTAQGSLRQAAPTAQGSLRQAAPTAQGSLLRGVAVSGLNPKGLLVFLALLPQFTDPRSPWPIAAQIGALGLAFVLTCAAFYLCLGSFARSLLQTRPRLARAVTRVAGAGMVVVGLVLVAQRLAS